MCHVAVVVRNVLQTLLLHTVLLALSQSKLAESITPYLTIFSLIYVVEIGLRLYAEG